MKIKLSVVYVMAFAMGISTAFAGNGKDGKPAQAQEISWDEFRARCQNPKDFDKQVAPENIQIACTNVESEFVADAPGSFALTSTRKVGAAVYSSKWQVGGASMQEVPVQQKGGSCLRFKEVERMLTIERPVSCSEILGIKGSIAEYCASALDMAKGQHPKMIATRDTGRVIDTCGGIAVSNGGGKGLR